MAGWFSRLTGDDYEDDLPEGEDEYLELDASYDTGGNRQVVVRPFDIEDFSDIKPILDALRDGHTIALVNIRPLKDKDLVELKRAINKLKKTCDAIDGDIAGFGDDYIVATPSFAYVHRSATEADVE
jgi:SepF-like predicted cell division protein (DUF552 family)